MEATAGDARRMQRVLLLAASFAASIAVSCSNGGSNTLEAPSPTPPSITARFSTEIVNGARSRCVFDAEVTLQDGAVSTVIRADALVQGRVKTGDRTAGAAEVFPIGVTDALPAHVRHDGGMYGSYAYCQVVQGEGAEMTGDLRAANFFEDGAGEVVSESCELDAMVTIGDGSILAVETTEPAVADRVTEGRDVDDIPSDPIVEPTLPTPVFVDDDGSIRWGYESCSRSAASRGYDGAPVGTPLPS